MEEERKLLLSKCIHQPISYYAPKACTKGYVRFLIEAWVLLDIQPEVGMMKNHHGRTWTISNILADHHSHHFTRTYYYSNNTSCWDASYSFLHGSEDYWEFSVLSRVVESSDRVWSFEVDPSQAIKAAILDTKYFCEFHYGSCWLGGMDQIDQVSQHFYKIVVDGLKTIFNLHYYNLNFTIISGSEVTIPTLQLLRPLQCELYNFKPWTAFQRTRPQRTNHEESTGTSHCSLQQSHLDDCYFLFQRCWIIIR